MGSVHALPGAGLAVERQGLNMTADEVREAAGGYRRAADQLRELHARGFERAYISKLTHRVVLERAHHDAVVRGEYGRGRPANDAAAPEPRPSSIDREGLRAFLRQKRKQ
jgi:hypothetical protein